MSEGSLRHALQWIESNKGSTLEGTKTFVKVMKIVEEDDRSCFGEEDDRSCFGVLKKTMIHFGDPFHIDDQAMTTHASNAAWGDTETNDHIQLHHRQMMHSFHDIHSRDLDGSQAAMDYLLRDADVSFDITTSRERQQRWCANQKCYWFN